MHSHSTGHQPLFDIILVGQGGIRTTALIHSPLLPAAVIGIKNNAMIHVADWYACTLTAADVPVVLC
jgi:hypothetical protein